MLNAILSAVTGAFSTAGLAGIFGNMLKDALLALFMKIEWKVVIERATTRFVVRGLHRLARLSTNSLLTETVDDIVNQLQSKGLAKARQAYDDAEKAKPG